MLLTPASNYSLIQSCLFVILLKGPDGEIDSKEKRLALCFGGTSWAPCHFVVSHVKHLHCELRFTPQCSCQKQQHQCISAAALGNFIFFSSHCCDASSHWHWCLHLSFIFGTDCAFFITTPQHLLVAISHL